MRYRIKKLPKGYIIQKSVFAWWQNVRDSRGFTTIYNTKEGAQTYINNMMKDEKKSVL